MSSDLATLSIRVDSLEAKMAEKDLQGLGKTAGWLEGVVKKLAAAWGAWKVGQFIQDATLLAARYETLGVVMGVVGNNAGYTSKQMEAFAKGLQDTGISMIESRNTLATMAQANIDLSRATDLARLAQDAAVVGNINSSEAFQRMIYGIQSGQVEILRTIGLNVNFEQSYAKLAGTLGKSAKDLDENEKVLARTNAVMEKAPSLAGAYEASMGTVGKQLLSMKRYADDLQVVFGDLFGGAMAVGVTTINDGLRDMKKWLQENKESSQLVKENLQGAAENFVGLVKDALSLSGSMKDMTEGLTGMEIVAGGINLTFSLLRDLAGMALGWTETILGAVTYIPAKVAEGVAYVIGQIAGFELPDWFRKLMDIPEKGVSDGLHRMGRGFKSTAAFYNGPSDPQLGGSISSLGGGENSSRSVSVAQILEQQRIWTAQHAAGGGGDTITEAERKKAEKRRLAWLQFQGENEAEYAKRQREWDWEDREERYQALWDLNDLLIQLEEDRNAALENVSQIRQAQFVADAEDMKRVHTQLFGDMGQTIESWGNSFTDTIVEACFTGKLAFSDLVNSILQDMARMAVQKNVSDPLVSWLSKAISGWASSGTTTMTSFDVLPGYATGTAYVPQDGPAYLHKGEAVIPAAQNRAGAAPQTSIVVNVSSGGSVEAKTQGGTNLGRDLEAAVLSVIYKHQRPGGALAGA